MHLVYLMTNARKELCPVFRFQTQAEAIEFADFSIKQFYNVLIEQTDVLPF